MAAPLRQGSFRLFVVVIVVQGVHVMEHVIQLAQVHVLGVPDDDALGLLGFVFEFHGTEEWLHLVFNVTYLLALYALLTWLRRSRPRPVPAWGLAAFVIGAVAVESWHVVEHTVIISNVIRNGGCPCPGIGDVVLGLTDTVLHFAYNVIAYIGTVIPFWYVVRQRSVAAVRGGTAVRARCSPRSHRADGPCPPAAAEQVGHARASPSRFSRTRPPSGSSRPRSSTCRRSPHPPPWFTSGQYR